MKLVSWNVNGLRAVIKKGEFDKNLAALQPDILALQETKLSEGQIDLSLEGFYQYWNYAEKKGYSGTAVFAKTKPVSVFYGMGMPEHDAEGRLITLEYEGFWFVCCYTPNSQDGLRRIDYRMKWEDDFRAYLVSLDKAKPVIVCGDLNVAHEEIDLKNPDSNRNNPGFSDLERGKMTELLGAGFTDSFRYFYPDRRDAYSWWSYRAAARERNVGWRIDYFLVSDRIAPKMTDAAIRAELYGSDHCPVELAAEL
ncbi:MAG: exodeoxyribonuclease III [Clostridia bacterium]|nr:exodeoxyribonuclease III [Clostridia bacterium]